jgi:hypothetical protein
VALSLLLAFKLRESFKDSHFDVQTMLVLASILMATCLVKYAFLPVFVIIVIYLVHGAYIAYATPKKLGEAIVKGSRQLSKPLVGALVLLVLLTGVLFVERYGVNIAKYHAPVADCGEVLDFDHCKSYGPWIRDYYLEQGKGDTHLSAVAFNNDWLQGMWYRSFFAISGATNDFDNSGPLTWPAVGTIIFASVGILAFIFNAKKLFKRYNSSLLWLLIISSVFYVLVLWLQNYKMYKDTGIAVAINGRYLLPIVPIVVLMMALAINEALGGRTRLKIATGAIVLICFVWGGGALTWVLRSHDSWYWPSGPLNGTNRFIQRNTGPYVPGYRHPQQYMP